jgi:hypothetical protein
MRIPGDGDLWTRLMCAVASALAFGVIGHSLTHEWWPVAVLFGGVMGGAFLYHLVKETERGKPRFAIDVGDYPVHMIRVLDRRVVVVTTGWDESANKQSLTLYALPREWFDNDHLRQYGGAVGVQMTVEHDRGTTYIKLARVMAGWQPRRGPVFPPT